MMTAHWQSLAEILAAHLLNSVGEGIAIALYASLMVRALAKQNSGTRFAMLFAAMGAVSVLPLIQSFGSAMGSAGAARSTFHLPGYWASGIVTVWVVIAAGLLAKIALGFWQLHKLRRSFVPLNLENVDLNLPDALRHFSSGRNVALYTSDEVRVPTAIGFMNPAIVIPSWAIAELTAVELKAVVLHELAHLRRWDDWTNLVQKIVRAVLFFHPAVWWIGRGLAREREMACDDFVLSATSDRRAYAQCLVSVAEKTFLRRGLALAQAFVGRVQLTAQRVTRIMAGGRPIAGKISTPAFGLLGAFSAACLIALPHVPKLIAFDRTNSVVAISNIAAAHPAIIFSDESEKALGAKLIPASFSVIESQAAPAHSAGPAHLAKRSNLNKVDLKKNDRCHNSLSASATVPAENTLLFAQAQPHVTNAGLLEGPIQPSAFLVVMQTDRFDEYGQVWSVCVWRLTVFHPTEKIVSPEVRKAIAPKST